MALLHRFTALRVAPAQVRSMGPPCPLPTARRGVGIRAIAMAKLCLFAPALECPSRTVAGRTRTAASVHGLTKIRARRLLCVVDGCAGECSALCQHGHYHQVRRFLGQGAERQHGYALIRESLTEHSWGGWVGVRRRFELSVARRATCIAVCTCRSDTSYAGVFCSERLRPSRGPEREVPGQGHPLVRYCSQASFRKRVGWLIHARRGVTGLDATRGALSSGSCRTRRRSTRSRSSLSSRRPSVPPR
jgi:hypothetical protein